MTSAQKLKQNLQNGLFKDKLSLIYSVNISDTEFYACRYLDVIEGFEKTFGIAENVSLFSAPGRTEIGGNHTDHQHGCVLAGSVNLDVIAAAVPNNTGIIRVQSKGYPLDTIDINELAPSKDEINKASALIRGVTAKFIELGYDVKGFDAYTDSNVLKGSGLSSSAAFEVLIGTIINGLFCHNKVSDVEIAKIGQYAENVYFGKPCGLMDQMASSVGGVVFIDFNHNENPIIKKVDFDFSKAGYAICIIDSGADHANLTDEYAAIPYEMKQISEYFGKDFLRGVSKSEFLASISKLRNIAGDRAILRALHFFNENERAILEAQALEQNNFDKFLELVKQSGLSSFMYLQNVCVSGSVKDQAVAMIIGLCEEFLQGEGAVRVHGGGFAGTVQAFVPIEKLEDFKEKIEAVTGKGSCHVLSIRPVGGIRLV